MSLSRRDRHKFAGMDSAMNVSKALEPLSFVRKFDEMEPREPVTD